MTDDFDPSNYEEWSEEVEKGGGRHLFQDSEVDERFLLEEEEYLDGKSICRRGRHCWTLFGTIETIARETDYDLEELQSRFDESTTAGVFCKRCGAKGVSERTQLTEGDTSYNKEDI